MIDEGGYLAERFEPLALAASVLQHLSENASPVRVDLLDDLRTGLRLAANQPGFVTHYDTIVIIRRRRKAFRSRRRTVAETAMMQRLVNAVPVLLVQFGPDTSITDHLTSARHTAETGGIGSRAEVLGIAAACRPAAAAHRIGTFLQTSIARQQHTRAESEHVEVAPRRSLHGIDDLALRRLQHIARLTRSSYGLSVVELNLLEHSTVSTAVSVGAPARRHTRTDTLCNIAADRRGLTVIPDTSRHPEARTLPATRGDDGIRFYAGHPIHSNNGDTIAMLCMHDPEPHDPADFDFDLLRDLALLAEGELIDAYRRTTT